MHKSKVIGRRLPAGIPTKQKIQSSKGTLDALAFVLGSMDSESSAFDRLQSGGCVLGRSTAAASVDIGSSLKLEEGPAQYESCFSTAVVSMDGLELTEQVELS
ncbi:hypothetical protein D5086_005627 [Populus alba]|uniref:Uncharacterized protein n=1 Tax=Populus alba TaxID=43335 RepID=A0ACC4CTY6_POPAL